MPASTRPSALPKATLADTLGIVADVFLPNVAKGVILRRPGVVALAERLDLDRRAVRRMQRLRDRYGAGPLLLRLPVRNQAVILDPDHVHRVLEESPEPFATASSEKVAALAHFQPRGALVSHPPERTDRRRFNEQVLESDHPVHRLAARFVAVAEDEAGRLAAEVRGGGGELAWDGFVRAWFRVVRRVVFGDGAREDHALTDLMAELRADANWAFLKPRRTGLREQLFARIEGHLARAEPGSLAAVMARTRTTERTAPTQQVPQWLFAFDPAGMATFRALALLAAHPDAADRARREVLDGGTEPGAVLPYLRAAILESLRLWPTTPMVLRQTTRETTWEEGTMPAGTGVLLFAPFFHRDDQRLPFADRFSPEVWLQERTRDDWPLIPFSGGPGLCPGRQLVLLLGSRVLAALLSAGPVLPLQPVRLRAGRPLPGTLNPFSLRFRLAA